MPQSFLEARQFFIAVFLGELVHDDLHIASSER